MSAVSVGRRAHGTGRRGAWLLVGLLIAALIGYYLPWLSSPAAALSAHAFDLAEWVGLSPAQRTGSPPMLAPFFLRASLAGLSLLLGLRARASGGLGRLVLAALALILALTLIPPVEFFREAPDDINYQQLMALCIAALAGLGAIALLHRWHRLPWRRLEASFGALLVVSAITGEALALDVIRNLKIDAPIGPGFVLFVASVGSFTLVAFLLRSPPQEPPHPQ